MGSSLLLRPGGGPNDAALKLTHSATIRNCALIGEQHVQKITL
jgi:hypothetical protein